MSIIICPCVLNTYSVPIVGSRNIINVSTNLRIVIYDIIGDINIVKFMQQQETEVSILIFTTF